MTRIASKVVISKSRALKLIHATAARARISYSITVADQQRRRRASRGSPGGLIDKQRRQRQDAVREGTASHSAAHPWPTEDRPGRQAGVLWPTGRSRELYDGRVGRRDLTEPASRRR